MLQSLSIKNYALIRELEMKPAKGLNIITGETGAGKSIMLGAIGLLLGNRADTKVLFDENEKCIIEGSFDIEPYNLEGLFDEEELDYAPTCIIRREISPQNKSRSFVNDTPVNLDTLKKLGSRLMDIHSQHDTLQLASGEFQLGITDACAGNANLLVDYKKVYGQYKKLNSEFEVLSINAANAKKEFDYNNFLLQELLDVNLREGEQEELEEELQLLENAGEIKSRLNMVMQSLEDENHGIIGSLKSSSKSLEYIAKLSQAYASMKERIDSVLIELKDVSAEAEVEEQKVDFNNERIEEVKERLGKLYQLQQKHQLRTVAELLKLQEELAAKVQQVDNIDEALAKLKKAIQEQYAKVLELAEQLSSRRISVKESITQQLESLLKEVGIVNASFEIRIEPIEPTLFGADKVTFLFSANKGVALQELKNAASGGEFSRLMLCLKYIVANKTAMPVIVFDEIDTGISGEVAIKVGKIMKQMAQSHQIISISHLPQLAALGSSHYFVYKDNSSTRTVSKIRQLASDERIMQIAQMIGGENPSQTAMQSAKELMEL